ncbi:flagellar hook protein FlgE [bacterium]|nr:flagellar hook protein FlgE [bacterium]
MLRSLFTGISGLTSHQTRLDVVGNNIANVNTSGYKSGRVNFSDMMSQTLSGASPSQGGRGGTNPLQVGLGVNMASITNIHTQGALQSTGVMTDLAIQGDGFFILGDGAQNWYTRDGSFGLDADGFMVEPSNGLKVQGWTAINGVLDTTQPIGDIQIPIAAEMTALQTANAEVIGNLDSTAAVGDTYSNTFIVYDSLGDSHNATVTYTKTGVNTWDWVASGTGIVSAPPVNGGTLTYNADGSLNTQTGTLSIATTNGSTTPLPVAIDFSTTTQLASGNTVNLFGQDGYPPGTLTAFNISNSGIVSGVFDNGIIQTMGQISMARFTNNSGLMKEGDNLWAESVNSGVSQVGTANTGARGGIQAGSLEMSNVNLASEFSDMIVTQRGFQANSRIITTSDEILQELINMKR